MHITKIFMVQEVMGHVMTHEWERAHSLMVCLSWYVFGSRRGGDWKSYCFNESIRQH